MLPVGGCPGEAGGTRRLRAYHRRQMAMRDPKEPVTRTALIGSARRLLDWLGWIYVDRVLVLEGQEHHGTLPDTFLESSFDRWDEALREAPAALIEAPALRLVVEEAIAEAQLRLVEQFGPKVGRERAVEIMRDFGRAVDRARFGVTRGHRFRAWLSGALALPAPPPSGATPDDVRLRARVEALSEDERRSTTELDVEFTETLTDLTPLAALPSLRRLHILSAPLLVDLAPLARLPALEALRVCAPTLRDLSPLAGLSHLLRLTLEVDERVDLSFLRAMTHLEELALDECDDLSSLAGLASLKKLVLGGRHVEPDLEPLRGLVGMRHLGLGGLKRDPTDVVRSLRSLVVLHLSRIAVPVSLAALADLTELEELEVILGSVTDLPALRHFPKLRVLNLSLTDVRAVPPLRDLPRLEELKLSQTALTGLAGVEHGLELRKLEVGPSDARAFSDLGPLAGLTKLEVLGLDSIDHLVDLSPLRGLTALRLLYLADCAARDLTPLAGLTSLEDLSLSGTPIEDLGPLAGLPKLRWLRLSRCEALRSLRPLAACPRLEFLEVDDCDELRGPRTLEQLRAAPAEKPPAKRFPSGGPPPAHPGAVATFDARAHLPKRPPEGWSLPEWDGGEDQMFWLEADGNVRVSLTLMSRDEASHLVMVHMWRLDRTPLADKQVARILRRLRASDSFVESQEKLVGDAPGVRCFIARAHAASPDTWGAARVRGPLLVVEEGASDAGPEGRESDVRHHLPSPLPDGWSVRATKKEPEDVACHISTPDMDLSVLLRPLESSDALDLVVSIVPGPGSSKKLVSDETARSLLTPFRGRGPFEERPMGPFARFPGLRAFVAHTRTGPAR